MTKKVYFKILRPPRPLERERPFQQGRELLRKEVFSLHQEINPCFVNNRVLILYVFFMQKNNKVLLNE
jgi:hypothetical protein